MAAVPPGDVVSAHGTTVAYAGVVHQRYVDL